MVIDSKSKEVSINCEHIENFFEDEETKSLKLVYYIQVKNILGNIKKQMEKREEYYECAEDVLMLKTY